MNDPFVHSSSWSNPFQPSVTFHIETIHFYNLKIIRLLHPRYHPKITEKILANEKGKTDHIDTA